MSRGKIVNVSEVANTLNGATLEEGTIAIVNTGEGQWSVILHDGVTEGGIPIGATNGLLVSNGNPVKLAASYADYSNNKYIQIRPGENDSHIHIDSGDNGLYDVILGDDTRFVSVDHLGFIRINDGGNEWQFKGGKLKFPSQTPVSSIGSAGDEAGMIAVDSNYIYYCTADYQVGTWTSISVSNATDYNDNVTFRWRADVADITNLNQPLRLTNVSFNGTIVESLQIDSYTLVSGNTYDFYMTGFAGSYQNSELQYSVTEAPDIWKRVAWSNDTW
jgi:hypothetical protein